MFRRAFCSRIAAYAAVAVVFFCLPALHAQESRSFEPDSSSAPPVNGARPDTTPVFKRAAAMPDSVVELDRMVVTATKISQSRDMVVEDVKVVTKDEIERSGVRSVMELLDGMPGIDIDPARTQTSLMINGMGGHYVKLLIDGIPVTGEVGGGYPLENLPLNNVERVEVMSGAASTMYGSDALGGVVNFITRGRSRATPLGLNAKIGWVNNDSIGAWAGKQQASLRLVHSNALVRVTGYGGVDLDPYGLIHKRYYPRDDFTGKNYVYPQRHLNNGGGSVDWFAAENLTLGIDGAFSSSGETYSSDNDFEQAAQINTISKRFNLTANYYPSGKFTTTGYVSLRPTDHANTSINYRFDSTTTTNTDFADMEGEWRVNGSDVVPFGKRSAVMAGVNVLREEIASDNLSRPRVNRIQGGLFGALTWESDWPMPVIFNPSARATFYRGEKDGKDEIRLADVSPKLGVKANGFGSDHVSAALEYGQAFSLPPLKQMFYDFNMGNMIWIKGNENLMPEKSHSVSATIGFDDRNGTSLSFNGFYTYIRDRIVLEQIFLANGQPSRRDYDGTLDPYGPLDDKTYRNSKWGFRRGFNMYFKTRPSCWYSLSASAEHVLSMSEDDTYGVLIEDVTYTPNSMAVTQDFLLETLWHLAPDVRVHAQWNDGAVEDEALVLLGFNTADAADNDTVYVPIRSASYTIMNLSLRKKLFDFFTLELGANNLLSICRAGYAGLDYGRTYFCQLRADIPDITRLSRTTSTKQTN